MSSTPFFHFWVLQLICHVTHLYPTLFPSVRRNTLPHKTVHSPLFFRKIIEIERFALRAAILRECQNYLGGGGGLGGSEKNRDYSPSIFLAPSVHLKNKIAVTVRRGISKRSHEKIADCEQSTEFFTNLPSCTDFLGLNFGPPFSARFQDIKRCFFFLKIFHKK